MIKEIELQGYRLLDGFTADFGLRRAVLVILDDDFCSGVCDTALLSERL